MSPEGDAAAALAVGAAVGAVATPLMATIARRAGMLDHPGGYKRHERATPYLGGAAILLSVFTATLVIAGAGTPLPAIAGAATAICLLGTIDDWRRIPPGVRLTVEAGIGASLWALDAGWTTSLPPVADLLLTVGWVLAATNAFNLIDNLDGTASSVAAASALGVVGIALAGSGSGWAIVIAAALVGACVAFLPYNLARPSRLFLGDGGSILLGFLIAAAAMGAFAGNSSWTDIAAAGLLIGVPLLEVALVAVSRRRRGLPLLAGGRDHLTHRIQARAGSARRVALTVGAAQAVLAGVAVLAVELGPEAIVAAGALYALAAAAMIGVLETREWASGPAPGIPDLRRLASIASPMERVPSLRSDRPGKAGGRSSQLMEEAEEVRQ